MQAVPEEAHHLFALWICTPSLQVQLEPNMRPLKRLSRWPQMQELYTDPVTWDVEQPLLYFRRDGRTPLVGIPNRAWCLLTLTRL